MKETLVKKQVPFFFFAQKVLTTWNEFLERKPHDDFKKVFFFGQFHSFSSPI